ncbi:MAG TPA: hotdog fold thioesterase [Flavitalea sp.]|nr:hotdog fold thioesterase [Flavitalea sp.]
MIWSRNDFKVENLTVLGRDTMSEHIGIEFMEIGGDYLKARMPVDHRTNQPYGLLHGGASCVLAETLGSIASALVIDQSAFICVGIEINANHIRSARKGFVTGVATALHIGKSTHVWDIRIIGEDEKLVCISRLTVAIIPKK